ncbi:fibrillarin-like rRNA/tRNA 2'-O-methyltransferase [Candidatus Woesearchaeota archaeon]|jgi:fibrillarin-like pre-rRNA processing protein|nr:fibrillarin-like rRNA/tRNA 2'-O-methyltransferase [Candidatus Woesearchaeota archaeon]MBT6519461.1 fibrillarin-like rRNA/tRNA 2'-O-methyltransferase [Candidatus Woesearchaeota archaeon]
MRIKEHKLKGIYFTDGKRKKFLTKNLVKGKSVYGEDLIRDGGAEYRLWDPQRSKLGAGLVKGVSQIGIYPGSIVLYLGASTGTTVSHVSDIVGPEGFVFALDFAPRTTRELVFLCEDRKNVMPILADASQPKTYLHLMSSVDCVFQDVAQRNQTEIFMKNCKTYLKKEGFGIYAVKSRSIDVARKPRQVFREVREELEKTLVVVDFKELDPLEKDHCVFVVKKK